MENGTAQARALLARLNADDIPHPGGTLLAHCERVRARLSTWGARPALQLAGLCHAFYGTDGFPSALLPSARRHELREAVGEEAEAIVYLYGSCDRKATYPRLRADLNSPFRNRFTSRDEHASPLRARDFADLTAANELDLAAHDPTFHAHHAPALLALFTDLRPLLSPPAWQDCERVLGGER
ncbi:DUF6817 domain-containing protein [Streptomyces sp. NPDC051636]|uniref:DUF6817 domain-containing protein n=1 Tax=Streptomyces sp. NPDC051636 TaxID=3365663 RepID=UPI00379427B8